MGLFGEMFGRPYHSETGGQHEEHTPTIHKSFYVISAGEFANRLYRVEQPEQLHGKAYRPNFEFTFTDPMTLDVFDEFEHPVKIERKGEEYQATVWCTRSPNGNNDDLANMGELVRQNGGTIKIEHEVEPDEKHLTAA